MPSGRRHQRMQRPPAGAAEEGRPCPWVLPRPSWATALRLIHLLLLSIGICCLIICGQLWRPKQTQLNPLEVRAETGKQGGKHSGTLEGTGQARGGCAWRLRKSASPGHGKGGKIRTQKVHIAELQLNLTVPRKDPTLRWAAGPTLGRSFTRGPGLERGQLYIHREGIYRLHIQVTLANCSSEYSTMQHRAMVAVGICSPAAHSISLLRLPFGRGCTVASQRLTHLALGDVLCTNLTLPLLPSRNAEETFFGIHWVYP